MSRFAGVSSRTDLSRSNYRSYSLMFTKYSELKLADECKESYRTQIVENSAVVPFGPIVASFDVKTTNECLELSDVVVEPYTPLKGEQLQVALQCLLHGVYKLCKTNRLKELRIDHNSATLNEASRAIGWYPKVERKSGDILYILRLAC